MMFRRKKASRVLVIGLDCASPELVFDQFRDDLPNLTRLAESGTWGELQSSVPCITIPAWSSMMSSRDPGVLGCYGFRNRADHSYSNLLTSTSTAIHEKRVWDYVSEAGRESVVLAVPQTYPPRPFNGHLVSDFLTPGPESAFAFPAVFKQEVLKQIPEYAFDIKGFRTDNKSSLLKRLYDVTEAQHKLVRHCLTSKHWDFFMHVNIGVDRLHHGFWRYHDPTHRLHEPNHPLNSVVRDYYKMVDQAIGEWLEYIDDDTTILVVSDHGVSRMDGGICVNEWLWREGWLVLKSPPSEGQLTPFEQADVDWTRTRAWSSGGYYGRVFLNVEGREPSGAIPAAHYEAVRDELAGVLKSIPGPNGEMLNTLVYKPEQIYQQVRNVAPDLIVYFGGLHWRSVGSLGHGSHYTLDNDTGPDDANHAPNGMFILYEPHQRGRGRIDGCQLMDIAPTLLIRMQIPVPAVMQGRVIG